MIEIIKKWIAFDIETTGLIDMDTVITTISAQDSDNEWFSRVSSGYDDESSLLHAFITWVVNHKDYDIISKNGKAFDVPLLFLRLADLGQLTWYKLLRDYLKEVKHHDIQEVTTRWVRLEDMAILQGLTPKTMNGKMAINVWKKAVRLLGEDKKPEAMRLFATLKRYCEHDVELTVAVTRNLKFIE